MNTTWGMIKKNYMSYLTAALLCALVAFVGNALVGSLMGLLIFLAMTGMQFAEGCDRGERACTMRDTIEKVKKDGKTPDETMLRQTYDPKNAVKAFLISALPIAVLALVNLILADPDNVNESVLGTVTRLVLMPAIWCTRFFTECVGIDFTGALEASKGVLSALGRSGIDFGGAISSLAGVGEYAVAFDLHYLTIMRVIYIFVPFIIPAAMMIGYLRGPKLREKRLADIAKGTRKKAKKLKVFGGKPRQHKQAKPQV